jgi:uncharacterized protein (DUF488 family)
MTIYTIGYTKKSAEGFFNLLKQHNIRQIVDIRENNTSQLAGYTKMNDLRFFAKEILNASYIHLPELAPDKDIRENYKKNKEWHKYEEGFLRLMQMRGIVEKFKDANIFIAPYVLLCSEPLADNCHRRLVAELFKEAIYPDSIIIHL